VFAVLLSVAVERRQRRDLAAASAADADSPGA